MKFALGLAAALAFGAIHMTATPAMAQNTGMSAGESGSNATDTKSAGMSKSGGKMSGGKMKGKKMKKKM